MDKDQKRKATPDINEEQMMNLMVDGVQQDGLKVLEDMVEEVETRQVAPRELPENKSLSKEKGRGRRKNEADYERIFLKKTDANARHGKAIYVRMDLHKKLSRIVQVIGEDQISLYAYVNNLLEYHFKEFGDEITRSFNEKNKPIL
ncbi:TPA: DUF3408 domain-containing protein [Elizabethkingia anophelis]